MSPNAVKTNEPAGPHAEISRRALLCAASLAPFAPFTSKADEVRPASITPAKDASDRVWWSPNETMRSRVVEACTPGIVRGAVADTHALRDMISDIVMRLTGEPSTERAWQNILRDAQRIVLKFNGVGANLLTTNDAFARILVSRLAIAGYKPETVALLEVPDYMASELGTRKPAEGWDQRIEVDHKRSQFARWLTEADAIINIGFIKTHIIAGMSCTLKNLAFAAIRNPAMYHDRGCAPHVIEIMTKPEITGRLRLNIANGLQVVVRGGPEAEPDSVVSCGTLIVGYDPVAVDMMALQLLMGERRRAGLSDNVEVGYLREATRLNVGRTRFQDIDHILIKS